MRVAKWGNSLAVRIPADVAQGLSLTEGDDVILRRAPDGTIEVGRDQAREAALARLRKYRVPLPQGYRFNREELYERDEE